MQLNDWQLEVELAPTAQLTKQVKILPRATKEKKMSKPFVPTEPGSYWWRSNLPGTTARIIQIVDFILGGLYSVSRSGPEPIKFLLKDGTFHPGPLVPPTDFGGDDE